MSLKNKVTLLLFKKAKAFSLLEVMIVLAILAAIVTLAIPQLSSQNYSRKSFFRKLIALDKQLRSLAQLQVRTYRINFQIKQLKKNTETLFWVDYSSSKELIQTPAKGRNQNSSVEKKSAYSEWAMATKIFKKKQKLPHLLEILDAELEGFNKPINSGLISIYFFPEGVAQRAVIHFSEGKKHQWSFIIHPFISKKNLLFKNILFKEAFQ